MPKHVNGMAIARGLSSSRIGFNGGGLIDVWDGIAEQYDRLYETRWSELENAWVQQQLAGFDGHVLDVGCGTGLGRQLLPEHCEYTGVDASGGMLSRARERYQENCFVQANAEELPFADDTFDGVISLYGCLSYCTRPTRAVAEIVRVAKAGSPVMLMVFGRWSLGSLLRGRWCGEAPYMTRGVEPNGTCCRFYGQSDLRCLIPGGQVEGVGVLAGVCEWPALWRLDRLVTRLVPALAHNLALLGRA